MDEKKMTCDFAPLLELFLKNEAVIINDDDASCGKILRITKDCELILVRHPRFTHRTKTIPLSEIDSIKRIKKCKAPRA